MSTAAADALRSIADLVESGLPKPIVIDLSGGVRVQIKSDELGPWINVMEIEWPDFWDITGDFAHARWPDDTFADLPFALAACRRVEAPALSVVSS